MAFGFEAFSPKECPHSRGIAVARHEKYATPLSIGKKRAYDSLRAFHVAEIGDIAGDEHVIQIRMPGDYGGCHIPAAMYIGKQENCLHWYHPLYL